MKVKELKELLNNMDDNANINFAVFDEYNCEIEGTVKFKEIEEYRNECYITLSAYNG
jgi:hypothetical protein